MGEDPKKKFEKAMTDLDMRLNGLLGALGSTLTEALDRLDAQDGAELRRFEEIQTTRGPLRAEAGLRIRFAGGDRAEDGANGPVTARRPSARPAAADPVCTGEAAPDTPLATGGAPVRGGPSPGTGKGTEAPQEPAARQIHLDHYTEAGRWIVCGDLPGVSLPEIELRIEERQGGRTLRIATSGARAYGGQIDVPQDADTSGMEVMLRNGVLEIAMDLEAGGDPQT